MREVALQLSNLTGDRFIMDGAVNLLPPDCCNRSNACENHAPGCVTGLDGPAEAPRAAPAEPAAPVAAAAPTPGPC